MDNKVKEILNKSCHFEGEKHGGWGWFDTDQAKHEIRDYLISKLPKEKYAKYQALDEITRSATNRGYNQAINDTIAILTKELS